MERTGSTADSEAGLLAREGAYHISEQYDPKMDADVYAVKIPIHRHIRKIGAHIKSYIAQHFSSVEKISIYESFSDRGKCEKIKYDYSATEEAITVRIEKKYYLYTLKMKEYELLKLINGFRYIWKTLYLKTIQICLKFFVEQKKREKKHLDLVAIDTLAIAFDITMHKKKYRFVPDFLFRIQKRPGLL